jgi:hypothetical protein
LEENAMKAANKYWNLEDDLKEMEWEVTHTPPAFYNFNSIGQRLAGNLTRWLLKTNTFKWYKLNEEETWKRKNFLDEFNFRDKKWQLMNERRGLFQLKKAYPHFRLSMQAFEEYFII